MIEAKRPPADLRVRNARLLLPASTRGSVDVRAVLDRDDVDPVVVGVNAVNDAVVASSRAVESGELELEWLADAVGVGRERSVKELDDGGGDLLGQSVKGASSGRGEGDLVGVGHRPVARRSASSLVRTVVPASSRSSSASRTSAMS